MTGPVLNKLTAFTADPHFRHILGQQKSTFSLIDAMDHSVGNSQSRQGGTQLAHCRFERIGFRVADGRESPVDGPLSA